MVEHTNDFVFHTSQAVEDGHRGHRLTFELLRFGGRPIDER